MEDDNNEGPCQRLLPAPQEDVVDVEAVEDE